MVVLHLIAAFILISALAYAIKTTFNFQWSAAKIIKLSALLATIVFPGFPTLEEYRMYSRAPDLWWVAEQVVVTTLFLSMPAIAISGTILVVHIWSAKFRSSPVNSAVVVVGCFVSVVLDLLLMQSNTTS